MFKVESSLWWEKFDTDSLELHLLAINIFSQAESCSSMEPRWNSYIHAASKKRNYEIGLDE